MENLPHDKKLSNLQILTYYYNLFSDKLIAHTIDVNHYRFIKSVRPDYALPNQMGVKVGVVDLLQNAHNGLLYAKKNVEYIEKLLDMEKNGKLTEFWNEAMLNGITVDDVLGTEQK